MHMFLVLFVSLVVGIEPFKVPEPLVTLSKNNSWVWFSLPEDKRISSVLYYTDYGEDRCPAYDYKSYPDLAEPWTTKIYINKTPKISVIVQTRQNEVFPETFSLKSLGNKVQTERIMSQCHPPKVEEPHGKLLFSETFQDTKNPLKNWFHVVQSQLREPHYEGVAFVSDRANSFVENNMLYIMVTKSNYSRTNPFYLKDCTCKSTVVRRCGSVKFSPSIFKSMPPFVSAKLRSKDTFSYCEIQIIAKMPIGDLLFPGITLAYDDGDDRDDGDDAIRIAIVRGNEKLSDYAGNEIGGSRVFAGAIYIRNRKTEIHERIKYIETFNHFGRGFHTYSVIWHENNIVFKVDGRKLAEITGKVAQALSGKKRHIELFVTVGGEYNFPDIRIPSHQKNYRNLNIGLSSLVKKAVEQAPQWKQPEMVIKSIKVYSTDESDN